MDDDVLAVRVIEVYISPARAPALAVTAAGLNQEQRAEPTMIDHGEPPAKLFYGDGATAANFAATCIGRFDVLERVSAQLFVIDPSV